MKERRIAAVNRRLLTAVLLACVGPAARGDSFPAVRIGVLKFETADISVSGNEASDLFSTSLYRNFPGLSVVERTQIEAAISGEQIKSESGRLKQGAAERLQTLMGLDSLVSGSILALDKEGGTLMMSARLVKLSSGEILWADTRTVRISAPLLGRRDSDAVLTGKLLELAIFKLVQDLGKRLPAEALVPAGQRGTAQAKDTETENCVPPAFYTSLARDRDWYYGVGKDPDTDKARDAALINLAKQVTGNMGGWNHSRIQDIAGPGQDQLEVIDKIGSLLPESTLLAGWEQDGYQRCKGVSYVLIRIEKERVDKFIVENSKFRKELQSSLSDIRNKTATMDLEERSDTLESRNRRRLEQFQESVNDYPIMAPLLVANAIARMKAYLRSGRVGDQLVRANGGFSDIIFSELISPSRICGARNCMGALTEKEAGVIAEAHRRLGTGAMTMEDLVRIRAIYLNHAQEVEARDFLEVVIYRKRRLAGLLGENYELTRELAFPFAWNTAVGLDDWSRYFKYCGDYLRNYPNGIFTAEAGVNMEEGAKILMQRNAEPEFN